MAQGDQVDRAPIVDKNFIERLKAGNLPEASSGTAPSLPKTILEQLIRAQFTSRHLDLISRKLREDNRSFYTIGSSGHEGNAGLALAFDQDVPCFLHYRSGAFMAARAALAGEKDFVKNQLLAFMAADEEPVCSGRHKVFGSVSLNVPPQTSTIASHLPKAVGTAFSYALAKRLKIPQRFSSDLVMVSFGDASFNHSVAQGAINSALWLRNARHPLPIVFVCEDNGMGISVPTPSDWIETAVKGRSGLAYYACDGRNLEEIVATAETAVHHARQSQSPVFLHMKTVRLLGHAGSDVELQYRTLAEIEAAEADDPLLHTARIATASGHYDLEAILSIYEDIREKIAHTAAAIGNPKRLSTETAVTESLIPPFSDRPLPPHVDSEVREQYFGTGFKDLHSPKNLSQNINYALRDILLRYPNTVVYGEDVGKKGGVYRVTQGLQKQFGPARVFDAVLDETTILGTAIGLAQNGFIPIPEIQFIAYLQNAVDQLRGEAATLSFFSNGQFTNPMVLRLPGLAYQKGFGGHFHNENALAFLREIPGLVIACPSDGAEAARLLRTCVKLAHQERRVVAFIEPIALYMTKDLHEKADGAWLQSYPDPEDEAEFGAISEIGDGEIAIISYGNGFYLSTQAARVLRDRHNISVKLIDLRWLAPLNMRALLRATAHCRAVVVVDETRKTASISEAIFTGFVESGQPLPLLKRVTGADSFIPLGPSATAVLPTQDDIVRAVVSAYGSVNQDQGAYQWKTSSA